MSTDAVSIGSVEHLESSPESTRLWLIRPSDSVSLLACGYNNSLGDSVSVKAVGYCDALESCWLQIHTDDPVSLKPNGYYPGD